jgi:hypothetical protein
MFRCYLIDPAGRSIEQVEEGFARATELTGSEAPQVDTLWSDTADPDSSVDLIYDPDADEPSFRLRLQRAGKVIDRVIAGPAVLVACGAVPDEIADKLAAQDAVASAVEFTTAGHTDIAGWLRAKLPQSRAAARRDQPERSAQPEKRPLGGRARH